MSHDNNAKCVCFKYNTTCRSHSSLITGVGDGTSKQFDQNSDFPRGGGKLSQGIWAQSNLSNPLSHDHSSTSGRDTTEGTESATILNRSLSHLSNADVTPTTKDAGGQRIISIIFRIYH